VVPGQLKTRNSNAVGSDVGKSRGAVSVEWNHQTSEIPYKNRSHRVGQCRPARAIGEKADRLKELGFKHRGGE